MSHIIYRSGFSPTPPPHRWVWVQDLDTPFPPTDGYPPRPPVVVGGGYRGVRGRVAMISDLELILSMQSSVKQSVKHSATAKHGSFCNFDFIVKGHFKYSGLQHMVRNPFDVCHFELGLHSNTHSVFVIMSEPIRAARRLRNTIYHFAMAAHYIWGQ